jgi:predicted MPP superfamily phosphohydrolase
MKRKFSLFPFALIIVFILLLNWYVLSGIQNLIQSSLVAPIFWAVICLLTLSVFYGIRTMQKHVTDLYFKVVTHIALTLLTAELVLTLFLLVGDLPRLFTGHPRNLYWVELSFLLFFITMILFVYGMIFGKYKYRVIAHTLFFEELPEQFEGFKVVQISDIHAGSFNHAKAVQRGIDLVNAQGADLFVFTGDLVNNKAEEIKPWIDAFSKIKAPYGQFSVLGNHDYGDYVKWTSDTAKANNLSQLKACHKELGFRLLLDENIRITKGEQHIILAGVENWGIGFGERGDLKKAMHDTRADEFKILLSHDPTHWEAKVKTFLPKVQLTLAGHTHGMQFGLEAFGIKWSPVKYRYAHWAGLKSENGRTLHINRGFGFIGFSGRIGIWPEITVLELKRKA